MHILALPMRETTGSACRVEFFREKKRKEERKREKREGREGICSFARDKDRKYFGENNGDISFNPTSICYLFVLLFGKFLVVGKIDNDKKRDKSTL